MYLTRQLYFQNTRLAKCLKANFLLSLCLVLISCSSEAPDPNSISANIEDEEPIQTVSLSPELNTIFNETCAQCHVQGSSGAPKAGNQEAWTKILSKGMDATLERVMGGYGGMPPAGQCFECTPEQLIELIRYLSSKAVQGR